MTTSRIMYCSWASATSSGLPYMPSSSRDMAAAVQARTFCTRVTRRSSAARCVCGNSRWARMRAERANE
ncbi:hypothetical protein ABT373_20970 [Streptomyces sp. NPDC000070]|uniref:hypothetical protein n=1 Tax=Streptomyces sp. NPDC000070 TaxID=3154240 RepID=UPI00332837B4